MSTLTFQQIEDLWTSNGGNPLAAPIMAAIAKAESGGRTDALNTKPPDYSVGLWQINYYGSLGAPRSAAFGTPSQLAADPNAQARAAIAVSGNGSRYTPWSTYTSGAYKGFLNGRLPPIGPIPGVATGGQTSVVSDATVTGPVDAEGSIHMGTFIPDIPRAMLRKVVGGAVIVAAANVALAGVFLLRGGIPKIPGFGAAPKVAGAVEGTVPAAVRKDEVAERRAARARDREFRTRRQSESARAQAAADAEAAGPF